MPAKIEHLGHASFRLSGEGKVVYVDPYKLEAEPHDATAVLVTHSHFDHCVPEDVAKVAGADTVVVAPEDCRGKLGSIGADFIAASPGAALEAGGVPVRAVAAYNTDKDFHPKANAWVGYVVTIGGETVYHAGDTDVIPEMEGLAPDVALLPVGGKFTMTAEEAAEAFAKLGAKRAVPMHFGSVAGSQADADRFLELVGEGD
jgi:L-ascorbate metabolism protein UlaG (beta-lactamase superfamily)